MKKNHRGTLSKRVLSFLLLFTLCFTTLFGMKAVNAAGSNYDVTPPVVEKVSMTKNGEALTASDQLHLGDSVDVMVQCYDAESEVESVSVGFNSGSINLTFDSKNEKGASIYKGTYKISSYHSSSSLDVTFVNVTDEYGNQSTNFTCGDTCTIVDPYVNPNPGTGMPSFGLVQKVIVDKSSVQPGEQVKISVYPDKDYHFSSSATIDAVLSCSISDAGDDLGRKSVTLQYDEKEMCFTGNFIVNQAMVPGQWYLDYYSFNVYNGQGDVSYLYCTMGTSSSGLLLIKNENYKPITVKQSFNRKSNYTDRDITAGDKVTYQITSPFDSNENISGSITLQGYGVSNTFDTTSVNAPLVYNSKTNGYEYTLEITDKFYPCEWRISKIQFRDDQQLDVNLSSTGLKDEYFNVRQKNTFEVMTGSVSLNLTYLDKDKNKKTVVVSKDHVPNRSYSYKDILEENKVNVDLEECGYTLMGIHDSIYNRDVDLDDTIIFDYNAQSKVIYAKANYQECDYVSFNMQKSYFQEITYPESSKTFKNWNTDYSYNGFNENVIVVKKGMTVGEYVDQNIDKPEKISDFEFVKWSYANTIYSENEFRSKKLADINSLQLIATYNKPIVGISYNGSGPAISGYSTTYIAVDEDTTYGEILANDEFGKNYKHEEALGFIGWTNPKVINSPFYLGGAVTYNANEKVTEPYSTISVQAQYSNYRVQLSVTEKSEFGRYYSRSESMIVPNGDTISLPTEIKDYKNIKWTSYMGYIDGSFSSGSISDADNVVVNGFMNITGYGDYTGKRYNFSPGYSPSRDYTYPTGTISIGDEKSSDLISDNSFDIYSNNKIVANITSDDEDSHETTVYYYVSDSQLSKDNLDELFYNDKMQPVDASNKIVVDAEGQNVIYMMIRDFAGHATCISSHGFTIDKTAPAIGLDNNKTYEGTTKFSVTDANLKEVTVDGKEVKASNGVYTLTVKEGTKQVVKATDKAGNISSTTVIVNPEKVVHVHDFNVQIISEKYLAKAPTCTEPAEFYYACSCGEKSDKTYIYGEVLGHDFSSQWTEDVAASTEAVGSKSHHCSRCDAKADVTEIPMVQKPVPATPTKVVPAVTSGNAVPQTSQNTTVVNQPVKEVIPMKEEKVAEVVTELETAKKGEAVKVQMDDATVISKDILKKAQETGVSVVLEMKGYSWTIDASKIKASDLADINLEVNFNTEIIPSKAVEKLAGGNPVQEISLTHEGDFGFAATLSFNLGSEYKDKFGNLYWYDSAGKMVFIDSGLIDEDGNVDLTFSHASDYAIVMKDTDDSKAILSDSATGSSDTETVSASNNMTRYIMILIVIAVVAIGTIFIVRKRRK